MTKHYIHKLIVIAIILCAFFLRFYKLGEVPFGLYQDETAIGYNAYSILTTGKDEHGSTYPLYFKSFGDYKLPVYIYLTVPSVKIFGLTEFAVRFPSALFGSLTVLLIYFLTKKLTSDENLALITTALVAVNPWHLHYSRATFEVSVCLFLFVAGTLLLLGANKRIGRFTGGTMCFVLCMYTYNLTRLLSPILYLLVLFFVKPDRKHISKEMIVAWTVGIVSLVPFILSLKSAGGQASTQGTLIFSSAVVQAPLMELRSLLISLPTWFTKIFFNSLFLTLGTYISHLASYLSVTFYYINGSTHGNHGIGTVGQFYLIELPLLLVGVFTLIKKRPSWTVFLLFWVMATVGIASLTREAPHATRSFFLIFPMELITAYGIYVVIGIGRQSQKLGKWAFVGLSVMGLYSVVYYLTSYYVAFPVTYAKSWKVLDKDVSVFVKSAEAPYDKVIFDTNAGFVYSSYLYFAKIDPSLFLQTALYGPDDSEGFSPLLSFDKYEFRQINWETDTKTPKLLIVTSPDQKPDGVTLLQTFYYPVRPVVIALKQQILQYPAKEPAYTVVATQ